MKEKKKKNPYIILTISLIAFCLACTDKVPMPSSENQILIGSTIFENYPDDPVIISAAAIIGDTLQITFGASCCSGYSWQVHLVGSGAIIKTDPPSRPIRLSLENNELCAAVCSRTMNFDLVPARVIGNQIILTLAGWDTPLRYNY